MFREQKDKPRTRRKYLQDAFLIKDFYSKYTKASKTKHPLKMDEDLNGHLAKEDRRGHWAEQRVL